MMIDAVMYGRIPNENSDSEASPPPVNRFR